VRTATRATPTTQLERDAAFGAPLAYADLRVDDFDGLLLPGGHRGRKTTALTWALERAGWRLGRIGRFWDPDYYRTYREGRGDPAGSCSVQAEVTRALASAADFLDVPATASDRARKTNGIARDSATDARPAWVVRDGNYVSARWPGDAYTFARTFVDALRSS